MSLDLTQVAVSLSATLNSGLKMATASCPIAYAKSIGLSTGTGANQADKIFHDQRTLTASSTENLDLAGVLVDAFGTTITLLRVKVLLVYAAAANTNNVLVGGAASNQFINWVGDPTDVVVVRPGGLFLTVAPDATGFAVTPNTGDLLKVANSAGGTSVTYDIVIIGASA
jgi:hypothetical protein